MVLAGMITLGSSSAEAQSFSYPDARRDQTVDNYFGHKVADPYRWMENDTTQEVAKWVKQENALTNAYLQKIPFRQSLYDELKRLYSEQPFSGAPMKHGNKYFFYKQDGLQNQAVLYVKDGIDGKARVFLNPNTLSKDGTVALTDISFSNDNKYMAYSISRSGSDWREIFVKSTSTGKDLPDHILWAKFTNMAWKGDGFFYSAYDAPVKGKEFSNVNEGHKIYYHKLGDDYKQDKLIYENKKYPKRFYSVNVYDNPNYLFLDEDGMAEGNNIIIKNLKESKSPFTTITPDCKYRYTVVASDKKHFYVLTNNGAERYRLMQASYSNPDFKNWKELVGQQTGVLENAQIIGKNFILTYNQDASTHLYLYNMNGKKIREIDLPVIGNADVSGSKKSNIACISFSSFTYPLTIFSYDVDNNKMSVYEKSPLNFDPSKYETKQVFFTSKDGTKIPMSLTYKKGLKLDGSNPVYLYGYGGFNISLNPGFSVLRIPFINAGGIYAQMNLRGGGEYGQQWHRAGTQLNKQNVFDDCIAAAEYLIKEGYSSKGKIALVGGSNGGLLVGAVLNQRPDIFGAAVPRVGVMDMLRYHLFTIGWNWAPDYGTSQDSEEMFKYLLSYSPLHTIKSNVKYPAVLVTTADHDDRVVPAHSFKYAATLQHVAGPNTDQPLLIRIDSKAGHGAGKPVAKILQEQTDIYAFIMYNLGMKPKF